ncbi:ATP-grasp domain-containing protein [Mariniflexile sp.]|uniref:ATP-grasp domain-containing protein n=1 Tax=Mariniflexile sp. TaxID=1979402 RepID=UPI003564D60F
MNILITSAGRRVFLVQAFQKELTALIPEAKVMTTDFNVKLSAACQISDGSFQLPKVSAKNYLKELLKICDTNKIKLIIPTIDTELLFLAKNKDVFLQNGVLPIISSFDFINKCRNKRMMHSFFRERNIMVAKEYTKTDYKLPLFIKPLDGSRSEDTFIIEKQESLLDYHFSNTNLMFLEYLDKNLYDEYTCDLYYDKLHNLKCVVPRKRLEVRDGEVNKGITNKNVLVNFIKTNLSYVAGAIGCLTSQFFVDKDESSIYGIEINARFGGGFPLTYAAGANYPKWVIQEYIFNQSIEYFDDWEDQLLMLRYDKEIFVHERKE